MIPCLTDSESESEDENEDSFNALPTTSTDSSATSGFSFTPSDLNTQTRKDGTVWSSFSSPLGRIRSQNIIKTRLHGVCASDIYTPKDAFQIFFSKNIVEEIMLCTNLQGRRVATKWNAVQKDELLAFIGVLLLAGAEKTGMWTYDNCS